MSGAWGLKGLKWDSVGMFQAPDTMNVPDALVGGLGVGRDGQGIRHN